VEITNDGTGVSAATSAKMPLMTLDGYPFTSSITAGRVSPTTAK